MNVDNTDVTERSNEMTYIVTCNYLFIPNFVTEKADRLDNHQQSVQQHTHAPYFRGHPPADQIRGGTLPNHGYHQHPGVPLHSVYNRVSKTFSNQMGKSSKLLNRIKKFFSSKSPGGANDMSSFILDGPPPGTLQHMIALQARLNHVLILLDCWVQFEGLLSKGTINNLTILFFCKVYGFFHP